MRDALFEALHAVRDDPDVRAMVLRGNGPAFSTGGDVAEFGSAPSPVTARDVRWRRDVWGLLHTLSKPTIAAVHGYAVGGGFEMALLCDLCIAADDARFCYPETGLAMIPGVAGTQTTPRAARCRPRPRSGAHGPLAQRGGGVAVGHRRPRRAVRTACRPPRLTWRVDCANCRRRWWRAPSGRSTKDSICRLADGLALERRMVS